jgi:surface antigen
MAKTVDNYSTIEEFRQKYNELAVDVGEVVGLRPALGDNLVDAVNAVEDKAFYFGKYRYTATANQQTFTGADANGNVLKYKGNRVQVFKNGVLLEEQNDWQVGGLAGAFYYNIQLISPATAGDLIQIYAYTGSFEGTATSTAILSFFTETLQNTIYNTNSNGVILQGDNSSPTTTLQGGFNLQLAGKTYAEDDITLASGKTLTAPTVTDGTASLSSGSLTSAVNGTFSGQVQAEHLKSTDDLEVVDDATIGGDLGVTGTATVGTLASGGITGTTASFTGNVDLGSDASDTVSINGVVDTNIMPNSDNTRTLGSSSKRFQSLHATTITATTLNGAVTGNVIGDVMKDDGTTKVLENSTGALTGTVSSVSNHSVSGMSDVNYTTTPSAGQVLAWDNTNQYWEPVNPTNTTDSVSEGNNSKYFTDDRVNAIINAEAGLTKTYATNTGDPLDGDINISVNTAEGIKIDGDNVVMDKTITGSAPSGVGSTSTGHLWFVI